MRKALAILAASALTLHLVAAGPAVAQEEAPSVSISNVRLALMQLVTATGDRAGPSLSPGTGAGSERAIYLQAGSTTLRALAAEVAGTDTPGALVRDGDTVTATLPIVVLQGAELTVGEGTRLVLDRAAGTFLLSFGRTSISGAEIVSGPQTDEANQDDATPVRPFLAGVGQGSLSVQDSTLSGLGYGEETYSAGVSLSGRGLFRGGDAAPMTGNTFRDLRGVVFSGVDAPVVENNTFESTRGTALRLSDGAGGAVRDNTFAGTAGDHALQVSNVAGLEIARNTFRNGAGKAVRVDDASRDVTLTENFATGFGGTAFTVAEGARCTRLSYNVVTGNDGGGIRADTAGALILDGNVIADNAGPGISIAAQPSDASALVVHNTLQDNMSGIRGTGLAEVRLARNDLSAQLPRILSGDLDQLTPTYLRAARDAADARADIEIKGVSASPARALRRDAAESAFDACSQGAPA
ncbi:right-handed parallel beta-helix repeat-containing protein [Roseivivax marinus]|uniref:right-handed parallel beta-helix repeat-containing protein n=1 Tax=Roseivivax marinus TaxID=1379903 RepID=UPI00273F2605|nr:right-handed parallel beta-helix repeat-containing protein [Roseivivax marinus]